METPAPPPPAEPKASAQPDDHMAAYLASVELDALDLRHVAVQATDERAGTGALWAAGLGALVHSVGTLTFPWTTYYQLHASGEALWLALGAVGLALWALFAGGLRAHRQRAKAARAAAEVEAEAEGADDALAPWAAPAALADLGLAASTLLRTAQAATLQHPVASLSALIVSLGLLLAFVLPRDAQWSGGTYSVLWFLTVAVAVATGILVGRFIMAAGERAEGPSEPLPPLVLPPWLRWANLALLCAGALAATFGPDLVGGGGSSEFGFSIVGLMTGIGGAIWIARRFDEWEAGFRAEATQGPAARPAAAPQSAPDDAAER